jgi:phosphoglucosamine mutase
MAILSLAMRERGELAHDTLVATVMSNLGMLQALEREGVAVLQTAVGDRYVLEEMKAGAFSLGGEQSGHVIFLDHGTTGDGTLTGLMLASRLAQTGMSLEDLAAVMKRLPQVLINVKNVDKSRVELDEVVQAAVAHAQADLDGVGRVLLRKSGTEPLVRVMVEADDAGLAQAIAERLADVVAKNLAL